jgi:hypothetical protein
LRQKSTTRNTSKLSKEDLDYLASSRPGPGPISMNRLNQQFARVLGLQAVAPSVLPRLRDEVRPTSPTRRRTCTSITASEVHAALRAGAKVISTEDGPAIIWPEREEPAPLPHTTSSDLTQSTRRRTVADFGARTSEIVEEMLDVPARGSTPVLYAVSGRNRVFQDRSVSRS